MRTWEFRESVLEAIRSVRWHWRCRPGGHTPLGGFLAAVRLEFNEPDLNAAGGYFRVAPGDVVEVVYVGSEEDEEEQGWVYCRREANSEGLCNSEDVGWLPQFVLQEGWAESRRTMLLWPGPVLCEALQCAVAARSDASTDNDRNLAGIAAHVRVLDLHRQILTGLDAQMHIPVRDIHEAEIIGMELSLWLLGHSDFRNCREAYERRHAVGLVYTAVVVNCDRQGAFTDRWEGHESVVRKLKVQVLARFPGCALQLEWLSRDDEWMAPVDAAARRARLDMVAPRPLWLCSYAREEHATHCPQVCHCELP